MVHYVNLRQLPSGLRFPSELEGRVWYESSRHRLAYDGFMSKATFDRLEALHRDSDYQRALEDLFRIATPEAPTHDSRGFVVTGGFLLLAFLSIGATLLLWRLAH